ncbi:hypothetical protein TIFTF001_037479 [Ficus carica]|uniref:Uncharacterized protein n=1 Tax=Ficus carica TaxID=3494 RepID=A0AA88JCA4_FICCA|nr:hypothetical protein TIFTF001_037329 [Ficus carica]GMN68421.1 hypothetical protein TIFTF001_037479 [Ficus carica]
MGFGRSDRIRDWTCGDPLRSGDARLFSSFDIATTDFVRQEIEMLRLTTEGGEKERETGTAHGKVINF